MPRSLPLRILDSILLTGPLFFIITFGFLYEGIDLLKEARVIIPDFRYRPLFQVFGTFAVSLLIIFVIIPLMRWIRTQLGRFFRHCWNWIFRPLRRPHISRA